MAVSLIIPLLLRVETEDTDPDRQQHQLLAQESVVQVVRLATAMYRPLEVRVGVRAVEEYIVQPVVAEVPLDLEVMEL